MSPFRSQSCTNTEDVCCPADSVPGRYLENGLLVRSDRRTNLTSMEGATLPSAEANSRLLFDGFYEHASSVSWADVGIASSEVPRQGDNRHRV